MNVLEISYKRYFEVVKEFQKSIPLFITSEFGRESMLEKVNLKLNIYL